MSLESVSCDKRRAKFSISLQSQQDLCLLTCNDCHSLCAIQGLYRKQFLPRVHRSLFFIDLSYSTTSHGPIYFHVHRKTKFQSGKAPLLVISFIFSYLRFVHLAISRGDSSKKAKQKEHLHHSWIRSWRNSLNSLNTAHLMAVQQSQVRPYNR